MKTCSARLDCLSSTAGNIRVTLQWSSAEIRAKKKVSWTYQEYEECYLCLLTLLILFSPLFQCVTLTGLQILTEGTIAFRVFNILSDRTFGQFGGLYSCSPIRNSFLKNSSVLNCLLHSCKSVEVKPVATGRDIPFVSSPIVTAWPAVLGTIIRRDLFG